MLSSSLFWYILAVAQIKAIPTEITPICPHTPILAPLYKQLGSCSLVDPFVYIQHPWYEIGRSWLIRNTFERKLACVKAQYELKADGKNLKVLNSAVDESKNAVTSIEGNAEIVKSSQFKVRYGDKSTGGQIGLWFQNLNKIESNPSHRDDPKDDPNYFIWNVWTDSKTGSYKIALVTNGYQRFDIATDIWILADSPSISDQDMEMVLNYAREADYHPKLAFFKKTPCSAEQRALLP